jgi:hypothetical protein
MNAALPGLLLTKARNSYRHQRTAEMELDTKLTMGLLANSVASEPQTAREDFVRFSSKMDVMIAKYTSPEDCKRDHGK